MMMLIILCICSFVFLILCCAFCYSWCEINYMLSEFQLIVMSSVRQPVLREHHTHTHTHTRLTALFPGLPRWAGTRKVKTNLDFTEARDSELQWYQLGHMQICTSLQTDNHASTPPLSFLQAGCPSCHPTNSVKALNINITIKHSLIVRQ